MLCCASRLMNNNKYLPFCFTYLLTCCSTCAISLCLALLLVKLFRGLASLR